MVAAESCCGEWIVSGGVGAQGRGPHDLFGGVRCATEILIGGGGEGQGWLMGIAVKDA